MSWRDSIYHGYPALRYSSFTRSFEFSHKLVMVRIKNQYLLVRILYPDPADSKAKTSLEPPGIAFPDLVQFHRPSPDDLTPQLLARTIRDQVLLLYGDYGLGLVSNSLNGQFYGIQIYLSTIDVSISQIPLPRNFDRNNPLLSLTLPPGVGSFVVHDTADKDVETRSTNSLRNPGG